MALTNNIPFYRFDFDEHISNRLIPLGSIEWAEKILGATIVPDYYPKFLKDFLHRSVWRQYGWPSQNRFVKPADRYKRFDGCFSKQSPVIHMGPIWCSTIISVVNEWRYYIADGEVLTSGWYDGIDPENDVIAPDIKFPIPKGWCGAIDFGMTDENKFVLIESQHPFSCGWYGDSSADYLFAEWVIRGWIYMLELLKK